MSVVPFAPPERERAALEAAFVAAWLVWVAWPWSIPAMRALVHAHDRLRGDR